MMADHQGKCGKKKKSKSKAQSKLHCIVHFNEQKSDKHIRSLSDTSFHKIRESMRMRQASEDVDVGMESVCTQIPTNYVKNIHGAHRKCYQKFTNIGHIKSRKRPHSDQTEKDGPSSSKKKRSTSSAVLFPSDQCIFCEKRRIQSRKSSEYLTKCVTSTAAESIQEAAEQKKDFALLGKIKDVDLCAREAYYHNSCRKSYTRKDDRHAHYEVDEELVEQHTAHQEAFDYICSYVQEHIISKCKVERLTILKEKYLSYLQEHFPNAYNANYKTCKLKEKLQNKFGLKVKFWAPNYRSQLIYSDTLPMGQAVEMAFEVAASEERFLEEAAMILRRRLIDAKKNAAASPWPPTATQCQDNKPPSFLLTFLSFLLCGKQNKCISAKSERIIQSYAQDICYAISQGEWKMAKHVLLGMTLRHMTGSAQLITLLNRLGHCQSYSQVMELETAVCNQIISTESLLPMTISSSLNNVLHFSWDNFDMSEETPSGAGTTHVAHGIVLQEVTDSNACEPDIQQLPPQNLQKTKSRSIHLEEKELPPCFVKGKKEPNLTVECVSVKVPHSLENSKKSDLAWVAARLSRSDNQSVPGWAGWVSLTGKPEYETASAKTTVDYMVPIHKPITENITVQQILRICQKASQDVNQEVTIITFDLAVVMKAYSIMWQNPEEFGDVLVRIGVFHTICSYLGVLGKMMTGTGFEDIVIEAGICASGSLDQVMRGKHYNRAMRVHKLMYETLERLLLQSFFATTEGSGIFNSNLQEKLEVFIQSPSGLDEILDSDSFNQLYSKFSAFKDAIRQGDHGKTAILWLNYMDKVALLLQFTRATRLNDFDLHIISLWNMCSAFFSFNHHNYARYLPVYLLTLMNLSHTHPGAEDLLRRNGFSVSRSDVPSARNPVDLTIEETINRHAKSHCGIVGFSRNPSAYNRWCITRHVRATYMQAAFDLADMSSTENDTHKEIRKSQITKSESDVQSLLAAFDGFVNPFQVDVKDKLFCLSSGAPATSKIESDLLNADAIGQKAFNEFVTDRLVNKSVSFHQPIPRKTLSTFSSMKERRNVTSAANKQIEIRAERNLFGQLLMISQENNISLEKTLSFPLSPIPWALATADGLPVKTDKSKLLHLLESDVEAPLTPKLEDSVYIIDGNAVLHSLVDIPPTFVQLAKKVFDILPKVPRIDFVTDTYKQLSIKEFERARRGQSPAYIIKGSSTKVPRDWKSFLSNGSNKEQLARLLLSEWQSDTYAPKLQNRRIYFAHKEECFCLTSADGKKVQCFQEEELNSTHEEADTRIILHLMHAARSNEDKTILIRSPDTDVFLLLLKFSPDLPSPVYFDTGFANKRRLIDMKAVVQNHGPDISSVMFSLHAFTGCDSTSAFVRRGKVAPYKTLKSFPHFKATFESLACHKDIPQTTYDELEHFVCCMYGKSGYTEVNKLRYDMFKQKFQPKNGQPLSSSDGIDLSLLPPCKTSLHMHIQRSNHQAYIWNLADVACPEIPSPVGKGWTVDNSGQLRIDWVKGDILPQELIDIMPGTDEEGDESDDSDDDSIDFDSMIDIIYDDD